MITLAIDTSTPHGSVAVIAYGEVVLEESFVADRSHSATLFTSLERARKCSNRIDQIAIGLGPGSYAGVRIAISAALGMQLGIGGALVGIPSVAALGTDAREYVAIGDARRETFYFTHVVDGVCAAGPLLMNDSELRAKLERHAALPVFAPETVAAFPTVQIALPAASRIAALAVAGRGIVQEGDLEPIYLREPHITQPRSMSFGGGILDVSAQAEVIADAAIDRVDDRGSR